MTYPISASSRRASRDESRLRRVFAPLASIVLLALTLVGCIGSPAPSPPTSSPPNPTVSPTPSYKPADHKGKAQNVPLPVMPAEAKAHTKEGLQAFMKHWVGLLSYAYETGDTGPLFEVTGAGAPRVRMS
ncbi:hypothetical protein GCM10023063_33800 [Arthrobacter methylotrophus]|uniref:DUF6318 family protein n=1 Tax=Arthrobacter methylotrophus TaxID=121291 RepID=UPI00337C949D